MRRDRIEKAAMSIRCVPRFGYADTEVRMLDLDTPAEGEEALLAALRGWFSSHGIEDAVYDVSVDDDGYFAIINDEAYGQTWGTPVL